MSVTQIEIIASDYPPELTGSQIQPFSKWTCPNQTVEIGSNTASKETPVDSSRKLISGASLRLFSEAEAQTHGLLATAVLQDSDGYNQFLYVGRDAAVLIMPHQISLVSVASLWTMLSGLPTSQTGRDAALVIKDKQCHLLFTVVKMGSAIV